MTINFILYFQERVKERSLHPSDTPHGTSNAPSVEVNLAVVCKTLFEDYKLNILL